MNQLKSFEVNMAVIGGSKDQTKKVFVKANSKKQIQECEGVLKIWERKDIKPEECQMQIKDRIITEVLTKTTEAHRHTKHLIEIDLHDAKRSIEDICIMGAINKDAKGKEILASLNLYLQGIWAKVLEEHSKQLKYDKLKSDNSIAKCFERAL